MKQARYHSLELQLQQNYACLDAADKWRRNKSIYFYSNLRLSHDHRRLFGTSHELPPFSSVTCHQCCYSQIFAAPLQDVINPSVKRSFRLAITFDYPKHQCLQQMTVMHPADVSIQLELSLSDYHKISTTSCNHKSRVNVQVKS